MFAAAAQRVRRGQGDHQLPGGGVHRAPGGGRHRAARRRRPARARARRRDRRHRRAHGRAGQRGARAHARRLPVTAHRSCFDCPALMHYLNKGLHGTTHMLLAHTWARRCRFVGMSVRLSQVGAQAQRAALACQGTLKNEAVRPACACMTCACQCMRCSCPVQWSAGRARWPRRQRRHSRGRRRRHGSRWLCAACLGLSMPCHLV